MPAPKLASGWEAAIGEEFDKPYYLALREFMSRQYASDTVYPLQADVLRALRLTGYDDLRIVILGQDPYHGPGQANGLAFSVSPGIVPPPSLCNIFKEIEADLGLPTPNNGDLTPWANQGVLLLNTVLTVAQGKPQSHRGQGWEVFTDAVIAALDRREKPIVFMLWGAPAKKKQAFIRCSQHRVLTAAHPSPLSAYNGWFGCKHFSQANRQLQAWGSGAINWQLPKL